MVPKKTTIRDIAKITNLSIGGVSQILSGKRKGRPKNVAKINEAVKTLNYRINMIARNLASGKTRTIGIVFVNSAELSHTYLFKWIEHYCQKAGYDIVPNNLHISDPVKINSSFSEKSAAIFDNLIDRRVDGIISEGSLVNWDIAKAVLQEGISLSIWEPETDMPKEVSVARANWPKIMELAVHHLCKLNHKKIHLLAGLQQFAAAREEVDAFQKSLEKNGVSDSKSVTWADTIDSCEFGYKFITDLYCKNPDNITGLVCADDNVALAVLSACHQLGIKIPEQLSIVGVNDVFFSQYTCPPLTTIQINFEKIAESLVSSLLTSIETGDASTSQGVCRLIVRNSTSARPT
jgi:LacI family transcriptional regulator